MGLMASSLGSYNGKTSTNSAQELPTLFSTKAEAEVYGKFFLRNFLHKTHPNIMGEITGVCGIQKVAGGYKVLVSTYNVI